MAIHVSAASHRRPRMRADEPMYDMAKLVPLSSRYTQSQQASLQMTLDRAKDSCAARVVSVSDLRLVLVIFRMA